MPFSRKVEDLLRDLTVVYAENMLTGKLKRRSKAVSGVIGSYLKLTPTRAHEHALKALAAAKDREKAAQTDQSYWDGFVQRTFYEALIAVFSGVKRGRTSFPPLERNDRLPFGKLDFASWAKKILRTNPPAKRGRRCRPG